MDCRIYVACLAAYVNGHLHGKWLDVDDTTTEGELEEQIEAILKSSPAGEDAEEWQIHDSEGFGDLVDEDTSLEDVCTLAALVEEHGLPLAKAASRYVHTDAEDIKTNLEDNYQGTFESLEDYAEQWLEDTGSLDAIPEHLRMYFDFAAFARDLELNGDVTTEETPEGTAVFLNH